MDHGFLDDFGLRGEAKVRVIMQYCELGGILEEEIWNLQSLLRFGPRSVQLDFCTI